MSNSLSHVYVVTTSCGVLDGYATIDYYSYPYAVMAANIMSHSLLYTVTTSCGTLDGYATIDYYSKPYAVVAVNIMSHSLLHVYELPLHVAR